MKKMLWIAGFLLAGLIAYVAAGPWITLQHIRSGLVDQDAQVLARHIDFPVLRQNLKEQLNATLTSRATIGSRVSPFGILALGVASKMGDELVETLITPAGLVHLMDGTKQLQNAPASPEERAARKAKLLNNTRSAYDSLSQFSVWVRHEQGVETRLVLAREGLSWKLVNILMAASP